MRSMDSFLRAVRRQMHRWPIERRSEVLEELRGHLVDRTETLVREGRDSVEAERQAVREMGPAWLLALRLSFADGWYWAIHILRELWALCLGLQVVEVIVVYILLGGQFRLSNLFFGFGLPERGAPEEWAALIVLCAVLIGFGFAMGRIVQGWAWAILPGFWFFHLGLDSEISTQFMLMSFGMIFLLASIVGRKKESPNLSWLAWASVGLLLVWSFTSETYTITAWAKSPFGDAALRGVPSALFAAVRGFGELWSVSAEWSPWGWDLLVSWPGIAMTWLFWLAAQTIKRFRPVRLADSAG